MFDFLTHVFDTRGFFPRWECGDWTAGHGWLHILSDLGVWSAYVAIPCVLGYFILRKKDLPFRTIFWLFGAFILACGTTHLMEAIIFWWPAYRLAGLIKLFTALVSWGTVVALVPVTPQALAMRSPEELGREIAARRQAEEALRRANAELEERVAERTAQLARANAALEYEREWLRTTLASIGEGVITTDRAGRVTFLNRAAETLTGWSQPEASGRPLADVFHVLDERSHGPAENPVARALGEGRGVGRGSHPTLLVRDTVEVSIEDTAAPIKDDRGNTLGVVLIFRDTTEQRARDGRRAARLAVTDALARANAAREAAGPVLQAVCENLGWKLGCFWVPDPGAAQLRCLDLWQAPDLCAPEFTEATRGLALAPGQGLAGRVWAGQQPVWVPDVAAESNFPRDAAAGRAGLHGAFGFPVLAGGEVLGVLEFYSARVREPDAGLLELAATLSALVGGFMDRRRREEELRHSEERFRQLADSMPQIVWTLRPDGSYEYRNRRWHELFGQPAGEDDWVANVHPDDRGPTRERRRQSLESGLPFETELRLKDPRTGTYRWHLSRMVPARDEAGRVTRWYGTSTDTDEQKRSAQASHFLADASAILAGLVDYESTLQKVARLAVPFFADWCTVDTAEADGTLRRLAVAHVEPAKVELARDLQRRFPPDPRAPHGAWHVLRTGQSELQGEITDELLAASVPDPDHLAALRTLGLKSYMAVPLQVRGQNLGVMSFLSAESDRRYGPADLALAEDLARRAAVALDNARLYAEVRDADRRKDEFLALLAHELRNPLAPLRNGLQIMHLAANDPEAVARARAMMERQLRQLVRIVDDLLDVSRISRGKLRLRPERVDLADVLQTALESSRPVLDAAGHELTVTLPPGPVPLDADPTRLAQVFANLLNNAAKFTPRGGRIALTAAPEGGTVVVSVRDTGLGIPPDMLHQVFEMFTQVDRSLERVQGGLGLGLTLVRRLTELHGGSVEARSAGAGRGSEFLVRLPVAADTPAPQTPPANGPPPASRARRRILVVDDNRDAAASLATMLRLLGHEVRTAHDGLEAVEAAGDYRPDLVFLDIGMPKLNGYDAARRIRAQPWGKDLVLVALTGWGQDEDRRRSREAGFDFHRVKPLEPDALHALLAEIETPAPRD